MWECCKFVKTKLLLRIKVLSHYLRTFFVFIFFFSFFLFSFINLDCLNVRVFGHWPRLKLQLPVASLRFKVVMLRKTRFFNTSNNKMDFTHKLSLHDNSI